MKTNVDIARHFPVVIVLLAVLSILFEVVGFASSGWLVVGKAGLHFGHVEKSRESGLSAKNSTNKAMRNGMPNSGGVQDTEDNHGESNIPLPEGNGKRLPDMLLPGRPKLPLSGRPNKPVLDKPSNQGPIDNGGKPVPEESENFKPGVTPAKPNKQLLARPNRPIDNGGQPITEQRDNVRPGVKPAKLDIPFPGRPNVLPGKPNFPLSGRPNKPVPETPGNQQRIENGSKPIPEQSDNVRPDVKPAKPDFLFPGRPNRPVDEGGNQVPEEIVNVRPGRPDTGVNTKPGVRPAKPDLASLGETNRPLPGKLGQSSSKGPVPDGVGHRIWTMRPPADPAKTVNPYLKKIVHTTPKHVPSSTEKHRLVDRTTGEQMVPRKTKFAGTSIDRQGHPLLREAYWNIQIGLWVSRACSNDVTGSKECSQHSAREGLLLMQALVKRGALVADVGGMATWNDLRVETIIGLCACAVGLVGTLLTVKPFCLKGRQRATTIVGVCGMVISWILFLVPIIRIAGINSTLKHSNLFSHDELQLQMPWAAAVSGIGACLALVTAGLLAFFTWADERQKWSKFEEDPSIIFKNDVQGNKSTCDKDEKGTSNTDGTYDNMGTMSDI